ncbi:non-structural maintenance of chromosomes element 3 homolog isoform X2 [Hydra vulgaris]|uniref:Non-structural maintenance of chromosomes element 3 homolog isoform X2 n=1 Tax=Hydra vulgaris TaxID=6087 RepID=A0ABM4B831_HYDVU
MQNLSQTSSSQALRAIDSLSSAEFKRVVADMVRYILFSDRKKVCIKKADLIKDVIKDVFYNTKVFPIVFEESKKVLQETFGFDVVEIVSEDGKSKGFVLVNLLEENPGCESLLDWGKENEKMGLLMVIISMIYMNEGVLSEASLWYCLKKLGIEKNRQHRLFGDVDKLIQMEFVKQNYLERKKQTITEGSLIQYHIGPRTSVEISKRKILQFVSKVYGVESIKSWKVQYQDVVASEQVNK